MIDELYRAVAHVVDDLVNEAVKKGRALQEIAVVVERKATETRAQYGERDRVLAALQTDTRLTPAVRQQMALVFESAKLGEVPVVLVLYQADNTVAGVRMATGMVGLA